MPLLLWDASGLAKRYAAEAGRDVANALFAIVPPLDMAATAWGYAETYSILLRRLNGGVLDMPTFTVAVTALQDEIVEDPDFALLTITDSAIFASIAMMRLHNLNATDAAILTVFLEHARSIGAPKCVVVAADRRLLRAASAEGLTTLNPETLPAADVASFLASL